MLRQILLLTSALLVSSAAHATDMLILDNGDRISGTFVSDQDGVITFNSPLLGNISVSAEKATVQMDPGPSVADAAATADEIAADADAPAADETVTEEDQEEIDAVTASIKEAQDWVDSVVPEGWTGKLSFGMTYIETDTESLAIKFGLDGKKDAAPNHYRFNMFYDYNRQEQTNGTFNKNLDKYGAGVGYDRDFNEWIFFNSDLKYLRDQVKDIRHQADLDLGIGFRILREEHMTLTVIPAYTLQYKDAEGVSEKWFHLATLKEDFMYQFSEIVRFEQSASASVAPADTSDYQYMFRAALISKLGDWIDATVAYQLDFDNTVGTGGTKKEQQLIFGLGIPY
ncbi:MAG: DUF481 domain-containing protein [Verrucomicrobiota bacterium]